MMKILAALFVFAFGVEMYQSQYATGPMFLRDPMEHLEPFSFDVFKKPPKIENSVCFNPFMRCLKKQKHAKSVCILAKQHGLVNFDNICEVYLQNCFAQPAGSDHVYGMPTEYDFLYYNGKNHSCHYYMKRSKSLDDSIQLYYKIGYEKEKVHSKDKLY